ncbi:hypothetical protein [Thioalkalivibrio sp. ALE16]|uniref:hypothetical protein n=1 Tax=Thioalkalivibrio sp. ALE16 TaxID=1158172 RepID=UPI000366C3DE|nr:hypothetical protein [Thioalkalivibrio sp. ALE16]
MHSNRIPVTLQRLLDRHADKIESYWMECDDFGERHQGPWSIWIHLKHGWINTPAESGTVHEATARDVVEAFRHDVRWVGLEKANWG